MDVDESLETYQRTAEDVKSMINYAKLDENYLTNITQAIYFPSEYINLDNLKLLELNSHLLMQIQQGEILQFKGGLNEKIVLCTNDKTYDVKEAEISNSILLIPDLKLAQSTSTSPLKSPTGAVNRSKDNSIKDEDIEIVNGENNINRILENRNVSKIFHEYFECREVKPRYRKLNDLLQLTRYSGPENEQFIDKNLLFTFEQFLNTIQCSRREFEAGLKLYRAIKINNRIRILENQYEYRVINLMLGLINENSWLPNEIDKDETLNSLNEIVSREIIEGLFDLYTIKNDGNPIKYEYREDMICRIIAQNILQQGLKFHIDEFMTTWQEALPEGMKVDEKYLCGIGIVDRESKPTCVRALLEINLSTNLMERLKILFKLKEKWTLQQIEPYIEYFTTPQLSISAILAKYARSMTDTISKRRIYVSKY